MQEYKVKESALTATADAIRNQTGGTAKLTWDEDGGYEDAVGTISGYGRQLVERTITRIDDETIETIGRQAFTYCTNLTYVNLPNAVSVAQNAFTGCSALTEANLTSLKTMSGMGQFSNCSRLKKIDLGSLEGIATACFSSCATLDTVIIRSETVCTLTGVTAFGNTPFASGGAGGTVYVPSALITEYQTATNWSDLYAAGTCNFVALEGSEYE